MKANYSKLLRKFLGSVGLTSVSVLVSLPSLATVALNLDSSQHHQFNSHFPSTTAESVLGNIAQNRTNRVTNPRPSIFNEPPYNQGNRPSQVAPTNNPTNTKTTPATGTNTNKNIIDLAKSDSSLTTLVKALEAAGLTEVLQKPGAFTLFAPTNAAFDKLPQDVLKELLQPENKEVLVMVLTYHVVPGKVLAQDLKQGEIKSLQGDKIKVTVRGKTIKVNDGTVIKTDIQGSNGVIHQIDTLILPPSLK